MARCLSANPLEKMADWKGEWYKEESGHCCLYLPSKKLSSSILQLDKEGISTTVESLNLISPLSSEGAEEIRLP